MLQSAVEFEFMLSLRLVKAAIVNGGFWVSGRQCFCGNRKKCHTSAIHFPYSTTCSISCLLFSKLVIVINEQNGLSPMHWRQSVCTKGGRNGALPLSLKRCHPLVRYDISSLRLCHAVPRNSRRSRRRSSYTTGN